MVERLRLSVGRLIDGTSRPPLGEAALLIEGPKIVAIGPEATVPRPEAARTLDFPKATALPGLIDPHVHVTFSGGEDPLASLLQESDEDLVVRGAVNAERLLRSGITTAFDCGARGLTAFRVREAIQRKLVLGPRLLVSGRPVTPSAGHCHFLGGAADGVAGVRAAVRQLIEAEGADAIKVMATGGTMTAGTDPTTPSYEGHVLEAAVGETHRLDRWITAHAHGVSGIRAAVNAGFDAIEHATMLGADGAWSFDQDLAVEMARRGTRVVPMLAHGSYMERVRNAILLREAGVTLVPGTDVGVKRTDFSDELLNELEAHVAAGTAALDVLRLASETAARHLGVVAVTGTLEAGKMADVLVVDGSPDHEIGALRRPRLVLAEGVPVSPTPAARPRESSIPLRDKAEEGLEWR